MSVRHCTNKNKGKGKDKNNRKSKRKTNTNCNNSCGHWSFHCSTKRLSQIVTIIARFFGRRRLEIIRVNHSGKDESSSDFILITCLLMQYLWHAVSWAAKLGLANVFVLALDYGFCSNRTLIKVSFKCSFDSALRTLWAY